MSASMRLAISVHDGWRAMVRAAAGKLTRECRCDLKQRKARKAFYREALASHAPARKRVKHVRM